MDNLIFKLNLISPLMSEYLGGDILTEWPPNNDWPVVVDKDGVVVSRWGDNIWRLDIWAGRKICLNFGDGVKRKGIQSIDRHNADLLRVITGWWLYGPNSPVGIRGLKVKFDKMRRIMCFCTENGIEASELNKRLDLMNALRDYLPVSRVNEFFRILHELYNSREYIGFTLLDLNGLKILKNLYKNHVSHQTPYIPPRIWLYQNSRLRLMAKDFWDNILCFESLFEILIELNNACKAKGEEFATQTKGRQLKVIVNENKKAWDIIYKWIDKRRGGENILDIQKFIRLLRDVCFGIILNYSLMRADEAWSLKVNCLNVEEHENYGSVYLLKGRTSKTIKVEDTFWVASPEVKVSIDIMEWIMKYNDMALVSVNGETGWLFNYIRLPWSKINKWKYSGAQVNIPSFSRIYMDNKLFSSKELRITEEDLSVAKIANPDLDEIYKVDNEWPLAWHQLRRTGAVNMQASGMVSDSALQFQLKHETRAMVLYYSKNFSKIKLEQSAKDLYVSALHEAFFSNVKSLSEGNVISPYGAKRKEEILRLVTDGDYKKIVKMAKQGVIGFKPIILGVCTNREICQYGGIDNISHCGGGDAKEGLVKPCTHVLYDKSKARIIDDFEVLLNERLQKAPQGSPMEESLMAQKRSVENYRENIRK